MKMKVLVTGSGGQLAKEIRQISQNHNYDWLFCDREKFDISDLENINNYLNSISPNLIINCAAYTSVDKAESDYEQANTVNHLSVGLISKWCNNNNCLLLHISSDYVYGSNDNKFLSESDNTNPLNNYGKTKLLGDLACLKFNPSSVIIRTSWLYSSYGNNFVTTISRLLKEKNKINVVADQIGSPTYAADLAEVIFHIINFDKWVPGIYHYSNFGKVSWYDLANQIKSILNSKTIILPIHSKDHISKTKRQKFSLLDNSKIKKTFNLRQKDYLISLKKCINVMRNEK